MRGLLWGDLTLKTLKGARLMRNTYNKWRPASAETIVRSLPLIRTSLGAGDRGIRLQFAERYSRQVLFAPIGEAGQSRLAQARIAIVGCGATGSALASLLARAGVGSLRIIDRDYVEPSNLQRQSLFDESDASESMPKAIAACRKIAGFNSNI